MFIVRMRLPKGKKVEHRLLNLYNESASRAVRTGRKLLETLMLNRRTFLEGCCIAKTAIGAPSILSAAKTVQIGQIIQTEETKEVT